MRRHVPQAIEEDDEELCDELEEPASVDWLEQAGGVIHFAREIREELTATGALINELRARRPNEPPHKPDPIEMVEVAPGVFEPCRR